MDLRDFIVASIKRSTNAVFSTMLGVELDPGTLGEEPCPVPEGSDGIVSFIGLAGTWAGTGSLTCSPQLACRVCSLWLMTETNTVNEDVLDSVAELTNMIIGNVKTDLEARLGSLGLSIPTVIFGRNFRTKCAGPADWNTVSFRWDGQLMVVKLCLSREPVPGHAISSAQRVTYALDSGT